MSLKKLIAAVAAMSLTATPVLAANPAAKLSLSNSPAAARASAKPGKSELFGGSGLFVAIAVVAIAVGIYLIVDKDNDPDSP